jgi:hypothetical protein
MEYLIGFLLIIVLPASIIFNILLLIRGINFVKQNESLNDSLKEYIDRDLQTEIALDSMLAKMREIDLKGSFESDDEVGSVFNQLKELIEIYKNQI